MEKKDNLSEKIKEGVSVQEIENFAKKYTTEIFIIVALVVAFFSSVFGLFTGSTASLFFAIVGVILSLLIPQHIESLGQKAADFLRKQDKTVQMVIGIARIVIAFFLPFLIFAVIGLHAGLGFHAFRGEEL